MKEIEPSHFSMPEAKLWHHKIETKNLKQMVEFIKTCDQYLCKFNFGHIYSYIVLPLSAEE